MPAVKNVYGFSLVELLTALFILLILAGMAVPMLQSYREQTNNRITQFNLLNLLKTAQQEAEVRDSKIGVSFNNLTQQILLFMDDGDNSEIRASAIIAVKAFTGVFHLNSYPIYRGYLQFQGYILNAGDNSTIWYCPYPDKPPAWSVVINRAHAVHIEYPDKAGVLRDSKAHVLRC
jgi:prepilin-type N-terminal cleavage/methylation domain-containing protein